MAERGPDQIGDGGVEVGGGRDHQRVLAAGLGVEPALRVPREKELCRVPCPGEDDGVHLRMGDQPSTDVVLGAGEEGEEVAGHAGRLDAVGQKSAHRQGLWRGLEDGSRPRGEGGQHPTRGDGQWEVPGRGHDRDPVGGEAQPVLLQAGHERAALPVPASEIHGFGDLDIAFGDGLAGLGGHDGDGLAPAGGQEVAHPVEDPASFGLGSTGPVRGGLGHVVHRSVDGGAVGQGDIAGPLVGCGGHVAGHPSTVGGDAEIGVRLVDERRVGINRRHRDGSVLGATGPVGQAVSIGNGGLETRSLRLPRGGPDVEGEEVVQEVVGSGVLVEATDEVGDGGFEVVVGDHGRVEQQATGPAPHRLGLRGGHPFQHLQVEPVGAVRGLGQDQGPGHVEEVVAGHPHPDGAVQRGVQGEVQQVLVAGVDFGLVGRRRLRPASELGLHPLHRQVGALHDADLDRAARSSVALPGPGAQVGQHGRRVGDVGLDDDPGVKGGELLLVEHPAERGDREVEVVVRLHVQVDEGRGHRRPPGAVQRAQPVAQHVDGGPEGQRVDLGVDGGDLHRHVVDVGPLDRGQHRGQPTAGLVLAEDGLTQGVDVLVVTGPGPVGQVPSQARVVAGQDHPGGLPPQPAGDQRHHRARGDGGDAGADGQRQSVQRPRNRGHALAGDEIVKARRGPPRVTDPGHLVGEALDEGPTGRIGHEPAEPASTPTIPAPLQPVGGVQQLGGQHRRSLDQDLVGRQGLGHAPLLPHRGPSWALPQGRSSAS